MLTSRDCELLAVGDIWTSARFSSGKSAAEAASLSSSSLEIQRLRCPNRPAPAATSRNRRLVYPGTAGPPIRSCLKIVASAMLQFRTAGSVWHPSRGGVRPRITGLWWKPRV
jgi:hypothetical protein